MKKFLSILMAALLMLGCVGTAFADTTNNTEESYTITAPDNGHTYEVYQIFTATLSTQTTGEKTITVLSDVKWGQNGTGTAGEAVDDKIIDELTALTTAGKSDVEILEVIATYVYMGGAYTPYKTIASGAKENVAPGYYLICDKAGSLAGKDEAYTTYVVKISDDLTISPKVAKPSVDKQIQDETADAEAGATDGWGESADHDVGEVFKFRLVATIPQDEDLADYESYTVKFTDTMCAAITFDGIVSVKVAGGDVPVKSEDEPNGYDSTAVVDTAGQNWTLTIPNVRPYAESFGIAEVTVEVIYEAHLNEKAIVHNTSLTAGGTDKVDYNKVYLEYSNNPNVDFEGSLGKTDEDYVWAFTYQVINTKYSEDNKTGNEMAGAGFTLYYGNDTTKVVQLATKDGVTGYLAYMGTLPNGYTAVTNNEMISDGKGQFIVSGLDAGTYTFVETTVPAGYNKMANKAITISATHIENTNAVSADLTLVDDGMNNVMINNSGATLPETGGIGTTLFYLLGGLMTAGSALILVVRRRADAEEE